MVNLQVLFMLLNGGPERHPKPIDPNYRGWVIRRAK
jgi:hypothetical protein